MHTISRSKPMTSISLRGYNREIESMVEGGLLEESITHCKHILKTFPMHLETYRLLGKTFLENRRYADATDIFQRVIMSVPDDFVANVGMSIIKDDEGNLDQATWHMERAFEVQPSNPAIQDELRKLYGRRDGVEPQKVRLTRDALANMYTQGALYSQAIAEIRAVLANDPNRPDLQVMLARAYSKDGRKPQAIELCTGLLRKYPYCFDALRILLDLMTTTDRLDIIQSYRQRVWALDPYSAYVTGSVFDSDKVADVSVTLEKLNYDPHQEESENQPAWASTLGIKLVPDISRPTSPGHLPEKVIEKSPIIVESSTEDVNVLEDASIGSEKIPDGTRISGWDTPIVSVPENHDHRDAELENNEQIDKADLPEWLKDMAPKEDDHIENQADDEQGFELNRNINNDSKNDRILTNRDESGIVDDLNSSDNSDEGIPEWLQEIDSIESNQDDGITLPQSQDHGQEVLKISDPEQIQERKEEKNVQQGGEPNSWVEQPHLNSLEPQNDLDEPLNESQPDWLKETEPGLLSDQGTLKISPNADTDNSLDLRTESISIDNPNISSDIRPEDDLPDWLKEVGSTSEELPINDEASAVITSELAFSSGENERPSNSEIITNIDEAKTQITEKESLIDDYAMEDKPVDVGILSLDEQDAAFGWLESLAARQGAKPDELLTEPEGRLNEPPDWVKSIIEGKATHADDQEFNIQSEDLKIDGPLTVENLNLNEIDRTTTNIPKEDRSQKSYIEDKAEQSEEITSPTDQEMSNLESQRQSLETEDVSPKTETMGFVDKILPKVNHEQGTAQENEQNSYLNPELNINSEKDVSDWLKEMELKEGIIQDNPKNSIGSELIGSVQTESLPDWLHDAGKEDITTERISEIDDYNEMKNISGSSDFSKDEIESEKHKEAFQSESAESELGKNLEPEVSYLVKPVTPDEWQPMQEVKQVVSSNFDQTSKVELISSGKLPGTGMLSKIPGINIEKESATLEKAQAFIEADDLKKALYEYGCLIKKGQMLEQVIHDLREITYRYPIEISIWQQLGDAYMRANRLQDALDAYTKAEELLR